MNESRDTAGVVKTFILNEFLEGGRGRPAWHSGSAFWFCSAVSGQVFGRND